MLLEVKNLEVNFNSYRGEVKAVRGVSFFVNEQETLAIVGESGSGKSVIANTIMKLLPRDTTKISKNSSIMFKGEDLLDKSEKEMQKIRGLKIGMVFQDPMTSLNPTMKIGEQIAESYMFHKKSSKKEAYKKALELLELVHINNPEQRMSQYPHELSGGMRQRVMIAISLVCEPDLLIADEPTTALDVTIQAQIIDLILELKQKLKMSVIIITHDLAVVSNIADKVIVMYGGKIMEEGSVKEIFDNPKHPYTLSLLKSIPHLDIGSDKELFSIEGTPPDLIEDIKGCPFFERCPYALPKCKEKFPKAFKVEEKHSSYCWLNEADEK